MSVTTWATGPSSVWTGLLSVRVSTCARQPGIGSTLTVSNGRLEGKNTCRRTVLALSRSFGTRKVSSTSLAPAGTASGCTVTWDQAGVANVKTPVTAAADATAMILAG